MHIYIYIYILLLVVGIYIYTTLVASIFIKKYIIRNIHIIRLIL